MRAKIFFSRGSDVTLDCKELKLTPDTLVVYDEDGEGNKTVVGEFYRTSVAGWKREG